MFNILHDKKIIWINFLNNGKMPDINRYKCEHLAAGYVVTLLTLTKTNQIVYEQQQKHEFYLSIFV